MRGCVFVIGLGIGETALLSEEANQALAKSDVVIGSARQLAMLPEHNAQTQILPPLAELKALLDKRLAEDKSVAILASGDPLYFGIGRWLRQQFTDTKITTFAAVSSIQVACHRLGLSLQDVNVISLHGRALVTLRRHLQAGKTLAILTDKHSSPQALAHECNLAGLDNSQLSVCERLGYADEQVRTFSVTELLTNDEVFNPLHVTVIKLVTDKDKPQIYPNTPGIADTAFSTGGEKGSGLLTKKSVRVVLLSMLQPGAGEVIWDIGAGCGGVSVELAYWQASANVYAIEHHPERLACLAENQSKFGVVDNLHIIDDKAPDCLATLPNPDKVFIGGSGGALVEILKLVETRLNDGGSVVASAVTESAKAALNSFANYWQANGWQVEAQQIAVATAEPLANQRIFRPQLPVTLYYFRKAEVNHD